MRRHCWWHMHRWGINTRWPQSRPGHVRWERHCTRCGALLTFTAEPFLWGLDLRARRAARSDQRVA
jgi:hypothetical protein